MSLRITALVGACVTVLTLAGLLAGAPPHIASPAVGPVARAEIPGSAQPAPASGHRIGPVSPDTMMPVAVSLRVRDEAGLQRLAHDVYDPQSPGFHHFLTPAQFAARFAPAPAQRRAIAGWLRSNGLHVERATGNGLELLARGPAGGVERAFGTRLERYELHGSTLVANRGPVRIPRPLSGVIAGVSGLTNRARLAHTPISNLSRRENADIPADGFTPPQIAKLYDVQPLRDHGFDGTGQSVALVEFADYQDANIRTYDKEFNISGSVDRVPVSDGSKTGSDLGQGEEEAELDVEVVQSIAPGAHVLVYEAPNDDAGAITMYNQIVSENRAQTVDVSWDDWEKDFEPTTLQAMNVALEEAAVQGQSVFAAAGDNAAFGAFGISNDLSQEKKPAVRFPGSDPWVTTVGGTSATPASDGSYGTESVWSNNNPDNPVGGGGGVSTIFRRPAYQVGPGVANKYSNGMRQEPDVATDADPGYNSYFSSDGGAGLWRALQGTSGSAPLWAGFAAVLDQALGKPLGFLNPTLYLLGQKSATFVSPPFHDITSGDNLYYPATPGWDFASGWGSFDGQAMLDDIRQLGGPVPGPLVDLTLRAVVGKKVAGKLVSQARVRRGQSTTLYLKLTINAIPDNSTATVRFRLALPGHTLLHHTFSEVLSHMDVGKTRIKNLRISVPRNAPVGRYTFRGRITVQGTTQDAMTTVLIK